MLGVLVLERDPLDLTDTTVLVLRWIQVAGAWIAVFMAGFLLYRWSVREKGLPSMGGPRGLRALTAAIGVSLLCLIAGFSLPFLVAQTETTTRIYIILLLAGGAIAMVTAMIPFIAGLFRLRWRRIWAITVLTFKEGIRRRILYVFSFLLLLLLFGAWFIPSKPEYQVRTYVYVVDITMTILLLITAVLVAAFSIPNDIKQQTIHTILTKPVERFEVVLGRFFGFVGLMTGVLIVMSLVSLIYVVRGVDPEAAAQSLKARDPLYGVLAFENTKDRQRGESVGREWDYRSYIAGPTPGMRPSAAVWNFPAPSSALTQGDKVRCEFAFDIYRTTKGYENRGVSCGFVFSTWRFKRGTEDEYRRRRNEELQKSTRPSELEIDNKLSEEFGYYEVPGVAVTDYRTLAIDVPAGLFRNAVPKNAQEEGQLAERPDGPHAVFVKVTCNSPAQYVGMARYDLYLRQDDSGAGSNPLLFAYNFLKGSVGLWFRICLVVGLAVALSTYLTGVISLLLALLLYVGGFFREFIANVAAGTNPGGGPFQAMFSIGTKTSMSAPMDEGTASQKLITTADQGYRWLIQRVLEIIPNIELYDWSEHVAEGFNIPIAQLLVHGMILFGYLFPWMLVGYYLLREREIAAAT